jgi:hypothetical protein
VFAAVALSGLASGLWSQRWSTADSLEAAAARLDTLPPVAGEWDGHAKPVPPAEVDAAQAAAMLCRDYVHRRTLAHVSLLVVCGRAGPVCVHTPDKCYANAGFTEIGEPKIVSVPGKESAQLWVCQFKKDAAVPTPVRVYYGWNWNADGTWEAAENPRLKYARRPVLYKLYVVREAGPADGSEKDDPALDLLREVLPQLHNTLHPAA